MIDLPSYSQTEANAISQLAARLPINFSLGGTRLQAMMSVQGSRRIPADSYTVAMHGPSGDFRLALASTLLPQMAVAHWPEITALPPRCELAEILFDIVLKDVAVEVEHWCGQRPTWSFAHLAESHRYAFKIVRSERPHDLVCSVECDAAGVEWIAQRCSALPATRAALDDVPLVIDLRIDRINLALADLEGAAQGDVILLDHPAVDRDGEIALVLHICDSPRFRASIFNGRLSVLSATDYSMDTPDQLPPDSFDSVNLIVDVDIGRLTMPLRHLRELAVGQVLDLGFDATSNVSLRVNGQVVATGELVRIAERTGVRLLDLRSPRVER